MSFLFLHGFSSQKIRDNHHHHQHHHLLLRSCLWFSQVVGRLTCSFVQNCRTSCKAFAVLKAISLQSTISFLHQKQTHLHDLFCPDWWDTVSFIWFTPSLFKSRKTPGQTLHKLCTHFRKTNPLHTNFSLLLHLLFSKRKKKKQHPTNKSYSAFITVTSRKHVILMESSNLQMARCKQHI